MWIRYLTNKDRLCEHSEPQSYPVVGRARYWHATCYKEISFLRAIIVKITWDMRELRKTYKIVRFYSLYLILGYFFTHCKVFLSNSHYALWFVSRYCVSGILPRFFAVGKPLPQGHLFKMRIGDVFPPRSGFVQQPHAQGRS